MRADPYPHLLSLLTYRLLERAVGVPYLRLADWLREFSAMPPATREQWQRERLAEVLDHARRQVPFYREVLQPGSTDLSSIPSIDKEQIKADEAAFYAANRAEIPTIAKKTGGSTGVPFVYSLDRRAWAHQYAAAIHLRERVGFRYGEPVVLLGAPTSLGLEGKNFKSSLRHRLERHHEDLTGFAIDADVSAERVCRADEVGAALWYGYASTIAAMARATIDRGIEVRGPKAIITTAEMLQPAWREAIEQAFGPRLYDEYGCNDGGILSQTCARGRFHLAENVSIVEVLDDDDQPCAPGIEGEVAVTNLHARALPFIRYRIGDRAVLGEGTCPCGTLGATLDSVVGRTGENVLMSSGREVTGRTFAHVFKNTPGVQRWQIVQTDPDSICVRLEVTPGYDETQAEMIRGFVREHCGEEVSVRLATDEPIDRTAGGKHRVVIRAF
jgi:phenylacetate-CoA ligase